MMGMDGLVNLIAQPDRQGRFYGVAVGVVTNIKDPEGLGRVKVKFPWLSEQDESYWARIVTPMAGKERGIYFLPEVDDEVLVVFEQGDIEFPYILGGLWNGKDKPPLSNDNGENNQRMLKSRSGHTIVLDDTKDREKIVISDKTQKNQIEIDSKNNTMTLAVEKDLIVEAKGKISIKTSGGDLAIECKNLEIKAQQNCDIKANASCSLQSNAGLAIKCAAGVKINDGALEVI
ncbi:MAG: phage baseplate assembly protein V [Xenococcaceae cyanobacterium]